MENLEMCPGITRKANDMAMATLLIDALILLCLFVVAWCLLGAALSPFVSPRDPE